jgi:RNA polymerase sigma-70 factor (ECF subfamily)
MQKNAPGYPASSVRAYGSKLYRTCKRYLKKEEEIEEAADAFYTIFTKLDQLKEFGAFEAWSRKLQLIIVWLPSRKNTNFNLYLDDIKTISQPY